MGAKDKPWHGVCGEGEVKFLTFYSSVNSVKAARNITLTTHIQKSVRKDQSRSGYVPQ